MIVDKPVETHVIHLAAGATTSNKTKLLTIEIKPVNGDFLQWRRFWEQFEITIHDDPDLSKHKQVGIFTVTIRRKSNTSDRRTSSYKG